MGQLWEIHQPVRTFGAAKRDNITRCLLSIISPSVAIESVLYFLPIRFDPASNLSRVVVNFRDFYYSFHGNVGIILQITALFCHVLSKQLLINHPTIRCYCQRR
jgi:hypothetical protein